MTLYNSITIVNEKIGVMYSKLYTLLRNHNVSVTQDNTFTELIEKVDTIPGVQYYYHDNIKPTSTMIFDEEDSLLRKEINIYYKIQYLCDYLKYALLVKGIPRGYVRQANTLNDLIDLINLIDTIKAPTLDIDISSYEYYYNTYINLPYTLVDENNKPITDGYIIVLEDNIEIARIIPGEDLKFLASDIGSFNYTFYYTGSDTILPTEHQNYLFNIVGPALRLSVTGKNIGESQYKNDLHILYDKDVFQLTVTTINPYVDAPLVDIPFTIIVPQNDGNKYYEGVTDNTGNCSINIESDKIGTFDIIIKTTNNSTKISNNNTTYSITIYHNPIKIDDYIFYVTQEEKEMDINCYNNSGELTSTYYTSAYKIIQRINNETYHTYNLANKSNPFTIDETHEAIGRYSYTYQLYQNETLICTTTNIVQIKREINIELIPVNKFLTQNTTNMPFYIYVTNYLGEPLSNVTLQLIDTYHGVRSGTYTTNNQGIVNSTINVSDILTNPCNGFLLQAVILEGNNQTVCEIICEDYSNAVYYRVNNDQEIDTFIIIQAPDTYSLEQLFFTTTLTIRDEEGERVLRPISNLYFILSSSISTSTTANVIDGSYANIDLYNNTYKSLIGNDLTLTVKYNGETDHYSNTINTKSITFIKSDVSITTNYDTFEVYSPSTIDITLLLLNINNNEMHKEFITGNVDIIIDNDSYSTTKTYNTYTTTITPLNAKQAELYVDYNGDKYTNSNIIHFPINITKTDKYNFTCDLSDDDIYVRESITFTSHLVGTTIAQQVFNGNITYAFSDGATYTSQNLNAYTLTFDVAGEYYVDITYNGDNNHYSKTIRKTFIVRKLTPTFSLSCLEYDGRYRQEIDVFNPIPNIITYSGNDEGLPIRIFVDNNQIYYNANAPESANIETLIDTTGVHTITLRNDETQYYYSIDVEIEIETYDFVDETYKIFQDILNENDYDDEYAIAEDTEEIFDAVLDNTNNYDNRMLERFYNALDCYDNMIMEWNGNIESNNLESNGTCKISWGDGTNKMQTGSFKLNHNYNDGLTSHTVRINGEITSLGTDCFRNCTGLMSIVIPNSVANLGMGCFSNCTGLTNISIPNSVTSIENNCFWGCTGLTNVSIPDNVTSIGGGSFILCTGLTSVSIPDSVTSIGGGCFALCTNLVNYQLYWETSKSIISYLSNNMPNNTDTKFTIPYGTTQLYIDKGYPSNKLVEREN